MVQVQPGGFTGGAVKHKYRIGRAAVGIFGSIDILHFHYRNVAAAHDLHPGKAVPIQYIFFDLLFNHPSAKDSLPAGKNDEQILIKMFD